VPLPITQVNAFTSEPFSGNPAAVCLLPAAHDAAWMQHVAREMNLAETAFLVRSPDGFDLRWFTPTTEVDLCGHATLASAHVLWQAGHAGLAEPIRFHTRSGVLTAVRSGDWIELDFPATPPDSLAAPPGLADAIGVSPLYVGRSRFDFLVEVASEASVVGLRPDFQRLAALPARGVIVTSQAASPEWDFVCRFFAPAAGIDEDPVTGSAYCCLAPFWSGRLAKKQFRARQLSARGGIVQVELDGDRVRLSGQAVTVWRGELLV
jgi:PhzF family phenazine biosynthesis protein